MTWISNLPPGTYAGFLPKAEQLLNRRSNPLSEMQRLGEEIISRVESANSLVKQLRLAVATSILSPIMIGCLIAIAVGYNNYAPLW
jgi:hypothetical protein